MLIYIHKGILWGIILVLSSAQGSEYEYMYDNNETCIDVKMDVLFTLSNGSETVKFDGNNFTVKSGDCAQDEENLATLTIGNVDDDLLSMTFTVLPEFSVNMSLRFIFAPYEYFPGTPIATAINLLDTGDVKLGADDQLYKCESPRRVTLTGELEGTTYTMYMDMSNVQIQAFKIKNGNLSTDVFVCSADQLTTVPQQKTGSSDGTTEQTTVWPSNGTTVGPSNGTTEQTTVGPSNSTTEQLTVWPSNGTTVGPSNGTTEQTTVWPSNGTTEQTTVGPSNVTTEQLTVGPSNGTTEQTTVGPSNGTTEQPTVGPSNGTTAQTTVGPCNLTTEQPTVETSNGTTIEPSNRTTVGPFNGTTEQTTVGPSNVTAAKPSSGTTVVITTALSSTVSTTASPITSAPTFPPISTYKVVENSIVCLIMEGSFQLEMTYLTKDNKTASIVVNVPENGNVIVTGTCASGNEIISSLTITIKDVEIKTLTFNFEIIDDISSLVSLSVDMDLEKFPDAKESEVKHTVSGKPLKLSSPKLYYKCDVGGTFSDDTVIFMFRELQVQAFNVEGGMFSENGEDCKDDIGPIPAPGNPPVHTYIVSDKTITCVVLRGGIQFNIPYMSENGNAFKVISLPHTYNVTGDCNVTLNGYYSQKMGIGFYNTWELTIYISSDVQQSEFLPVGRITKYHISQIKLDYDFNNNLFTDAVDNIFGTKKSVVATNLNKMSTDKNKSYKCKKQSTFNLQNGLSMITRELQYQAFRSEHSIDFSSAVECEDGENYLLLISTGAALGGLLLIVLVVAIVNKKRQSYDKLTF